MITVRNAKLIFHKEVDQVYLATEDEDGKVTLWDADNITMRSRHAEFSTAFNEACRLIGHERFTKFYNEKDQETV